MCVSCAAYTYCVCHKNKHGTIHAHSPSFFDIPDQGNQFVTDELVLLMKSVKFKCTHKISVFLYFEHKYLIFFIMYTQVQSAKWKMMLMLQKQLNLLNVFSNCFYNNFSEQQYVEHVLVPGLQ